MIRIAEELKVIDTPISATARGTVETHFVQQAEEIGKYPREIVGAFENWHKAFIDFIHERQKCDQALTTVRVSSDKIIGNILKETDWEFEDSQPAV